MALPDRDHILVFTDDTGNVRKGNVRGAVLSSFTEADRDAIADPIDGAMLYNEDSKKFNFYENGVWQELYVNPLIAIEESLTPVATSSNYDTLSVTKLDVDIDIPENGDYEYILSFDFECSVTNRSMVVGLVKEGVQYEEAFRQEMKDSANYLSVTRTYPADTLTAGTYNYTVEFGRAGGGGGATVTLSNVVLKVIKVDVR